MRARTFSRTSAERCKASSIRSTSALSEKGFSQKSKAPRLTASTAVGTSAWPVKKITGHTANKSRSINHSNRAKPLIPGMRTSNSMQLGCSGSQPGCHCVTKASALSKHWLVRRRERSSQASASRTPASSSMMKIWAFWVGCMRSLRFCLGCGPHAIWAGKVKLKIVPQGWLAWCPK